MDCGVVPLSSPMICNRSLAARASLCHRLQFFSHFVRYEIGFSKRFSNSAAASSRIGSFGSNGVINIATEDVEKSSDSSRSFSWDDVDSIATENVHDKVDRSDLREYLHKVRICNQGSEMQSQFVPFMLEDQIVGFIHRGFISHLSKFKDVFSFVLGNDDSCAGAYVTLHPSLRTAEDRSRAVGNVIKYLGSLIPGVRNELYPVKPSFGMPILFSLERAAAPYFGIKAYAIHVNGYVEREGQKFLWVGKRSNVKPTYPGLLDQLVAGGMPHGITCQRNLMKECEEEAGIPYSISSGAIPVGATSYMDIEGHSYKRDVLFCYDLKLPEGFIPQNKDGEVESFRLIPIEHVANIVRKTEFFKPSCSLVMIDFLIRHGYIRPDACGYLELLQSLRSGDCS